jgi:hypothetical protein
MRVGRLIAPSGAPSCARRAGAGADDRAAWPEANGARIDADYETLLSGRAAGGARHMTDSVPILMYHEITPRPDSRYRKYTLTPEELGRQGTEGMREFKHRVRTARPIGRVHAGMRRVAQRLGFSPRRDSSR